MAQKLLLVSKKITIINNNFIEIMLAGTNGMGQAQSQSYPYDCDECFGGELGDRNRQVFDQDQTIQYGRPGVGEQRVTGYDRTQAGGRTEGAAGPGYPGVSPGGTYQGGRPVGPGQTGQIYGQRPTAQIPGGQIPTGGRVGGDAYQGRGQIVTDHVPGKIPSDYRPGQISTDYRPGQVGTEYYRPGQTATEYKPGQISPDHVPGQVVGGVSESDRIAGGQAPGQIHGGPSISAGIPSTHISPVVPSTSGQYGPQYTGQHIYNGKTDGGTLIPGSGQPMTTYTYEPSVHYPPSGYGRPQPTYPGSQTTGQLPDQGGRQYVIPPGYRPGHTGGGQTPEAQRGGSGQYPDVAYYPYEGTHQGKFHGQLSGTYGSDSATQAGKFAGVFSGQYEGTYGKIIPEGQKPQYPQGPQYSGGYSPSDSGRGAYTPSGTSTYQRPGGYDGGVYGKPGEIGTAGGGVSGQTGTGTIATPGYGAVDKYGRPVSGVGGSYQIPGAGGTTVSGDIGTYQTPGIAGPGAIRRPGEINTYQRPGTAGIGTITGPDGTVTYQRPETSGTIIRPGETGTYQGPGIFQKPGGYGTATYTGSQEGGGGIYPGRPGTEIPVTSGPYGYQRPGDTQVRPGGVSYNVPETGGVTYQRPGEGADVHYIPEAGSQTYGRPGEGGGIYQRPDEGRETYPSGGTYQQRPGGLYEQPGQVGEGGYQGPAEGTGRFQRPGEEGLYQRPGEGTGTYQRPSGYGEEQVPDDSDSQVQTSVLQDTNGTQANAQAQGTYGGGTAQSQVSGVYTGSGSFSASAGSDDGKRGAQTQVSGGKNGAQSSAQGRGGLGQSQAQVVLSSETGDTMSSAQTGGVNHGTHTQVRASNKGGMADAQSNGPGSTSSQAQIGFTPYDENVQENQRIPFRGGGTASAQGGVNRGLTQSQIQGKFRKGIRYIGAAQAGSGANFNRTRAKGFTPIVPLKFESVTDTDKNDSLHAAVSGNTNSDYTKLVEEETASTQIPEDYKDDDYEEAEYDDVTEKPTRSRSIIAQNSKSQRQQIVLDPLEDLDATVYQSKSGFPQDGTILQPGELIPGSPGYQIPLGFRGRVKSIANGPNTFTIGKNSQAQSVSVSPGKGRIIYRQPIYTVSSNTVQKNGHYGYGSGYTYQPIRYQIKSGKPLPNFVSVSKSETGSTNLKTGQKLPAYIIHNHQRVVCLLIRVYLMELVDYVFLN